MADLTPAMAELLEAWQAWSEKPGDPARSARMVDAARDAGAEVGLTGSQVYDFLADGLAAGRPPVEVVEALAAGGQR